MNTLMDVPVASAVNTSQFPAARTSLGYLPAGAAEGIEGGEGSTQYFYISTICPTTLALTSRDQPFYDLKDCAIKLCEYWRVTLSSACVLIDPYNTTSVESFLKDKHESMQEQLEDVRFQLNSVELILGASKANDASDLLVLEKGVLLASELKVLQQHSEQAERNLDASFFKLKTKKITYEEFKSAQDAHQKAMEALKAKKDELRLCKRASDSAVPQSVAEAYESKQVFTNTARAIEFDIEKLATTIRMFRTYSYTHLDLVSQVSLCNDDDIKTLRANTARCQVFILNMHAAQLAALMSISILLNEYNKLQDHYEKFRLVAAFIKFLAGTKSKKGQHPEDAPTEIPALLSALHVAMTSPKFVLGNAPFDINAKAVQKNPATKEALVKLTVAVQAYRKYVLKVEALGVSCKM